MPEKSMRSASPRGRTKRQVLGRHYLASPGILARIVEAIGPDPGDLLIEIGPGRGALTFPLAERAGRIVAVEKDPDAVRQLREKPAPNVDIIEGDILDLDLPSLAARNRGEARKVKLVGNLPYSISSPLLHKVLEERAAFDQAAFLIQKEVAEKICARPGTKDYSPLSIRLQAQFIARIEFPVRPGAFVPPPRVHSAFFTLMKRPVSAVTAAEEREFGRFLRAAFRQKRRTLKNNLAAAGYPGAQIDKALIEAGIPPAARPEVVPIDAFLALFRELKGSPGRLTD